MLSLNSVDPLRIIQRDNVEITTCIVKSCIYQFQQVVYYVKMFNYFGYLYDAE